MLLEMKVHSIAIDPVTNVPIVILKDLQQGQTLPIWIGILEASAIATELEKMSFARPMTHDLLMSILSTAAVKVKLIEVTDLRDNVFYASIHLDSNGSSFKVDARPSDAIALALRSSSPIMVDTKVLSKSNSVDIRTGADKNEVDLDDWLEMLEDLSPEDFGKYKM